MVAGPGFGKSTLLAQALAENRLSVAGLDVWVGAGADHAAVSVMVEDLMGGLGAPLPVDVPTEPRIAARLVADAVWSRAPTQVALVLDDLHTVPAGSAGHRLVTELLDVLPGNGHLVLASRPPLQLRLSRMLAEGSALALGESDLAFASPELADFADSRGVKADLLDGISGWPALAELIATTGRRHVEDYLWEEVVRSLSPLHRQVLSVLAEIGSGDDDLLGELLRRPVDLSALLDDVPLVSSRDDFWTVHPLWHNALRPVKHEPEVAAALAGAPAGLFRRGQLRQAMRLLLQAGKWDQVREQIVQACYGITPAVGIDVLAAWQRALPEAEKLTPAGRLLAGTMTKGSHPWQARDHLETAAEGFRAAGDVTGEMACLVGLFHLAFWHNETAAMLPIISRWGELGRGGVSDALITAGLARAMLADRPQTAQEEFVRLDVRSASGPLSVLVDWLRANLLLLTLGEPARALAWARQSLPRAPATLRSSIRCELVEALRLTGDGHLAREEAETLVREMDTAAVRSPRHLVVPIVLAAFTGDRPRALAWFAQLQALVETSPLPWAGLAERIAEAAVQAGEDDEAAAAALEPITGHRMALPLVLLRISPAALALQYVLVPSSRARWDGTRLLGG